MPVIVAQNLSKTYRSYRKDPGLWGALKSLVRRETLERPAVVDVSFTIDEGEIVGFLGPNGAGKTTTLKMLSGILYPTSGSVTVLGYTPSRREFAYLHDISMVMGQKTLLWHAIPAMDTLLVHKEMYRLSAATFRRNIDELATMLDVTHLLHLPVRNLSLGERMKMELLTALVHRPRVLFLDEPTIGLDVVAQQRLRAFLRDLNRQHGTTIMLTSHYMDDIQALCQRVLLIHHGRLGFDGPLAALVAQTSPHKLLNTVFVTPISQEALADALPGLVLRPVDDPARVSLSVPREQVADVTARLLRLGQVADVSIEEIPVEEVISAVFQRSQ
jgi:ABC-2 type transport system ATP-binding protein